MSHSGEDELFDSVEAEEARLEAEAQADEDALLDEEANAPEERNQSPVERLQGIIEKLNEENKELNERMLRVAADMENLRARTEREIKDARTYGVTNFARDILSVGDNLRRAIEAVPDEAKESTGTGLNALIEGVEMTERELHNTLEKNGVVKLNPKGEKFDPNFHQAMFEAQNPEVPNNSVMEVMQEGYSIGGRVLRPALVGVAKGGPKFEEVAAEQATEETNEAEGSDS
jgi:molecular chaperone GrpE